MILPRQVGSLPQLLQRVERIVGGKKKGPQELLKWMAELESRVEDISAGELRDTQGR